MQEITYDDVAKIDVRIGRVVAAELVPETDKLIKCTVDFGDMGIRTIVSGIAQWKRPEDIIGKQLPYVLNLVPKVLRGIESQGMLLAARDTDGLALLFPERDVCIGTPLR